MDHSFSQKIPVAQAKLDAHATVLQLIEKANKAVIEAARAAMDFDEPMAANLFNADPDQLKQLLGSSRARLLELLQTGVPIWTIRLASPEYKEVLDDNKDGDAGLQALLKTFSEPVRLAALV